jgi:MFS family permease
LRFYAIMSVPIGRITDSRKRTTIIAVGIAIWSVMTAVCGLGRNFTQLFQAPIGVGVGGAGLSPGAYAHCLLLLVDHLIGLQSRAINAEVTKTKPLQCHRVPNS